MTQLRRRPFDSTLIGSAALLLATACQSAPPADNPGPAPVSSAISPDSVPPAVSTFGSATDPAHTSPTPDPLGTSFDTPPAEKPELRVAAQTPEVATAVVVSADNRMFVSFSRFLDGQVTVSLAEIVGGKPTPYPPGVKQDKGKPADDRFLSVQGLTLDANGNLWVLDTGKIEQQPIAPGSAKLVRIDLKKNAVDKVLHFSAAVAGPHAVVNDVRVDLYRGKQGVAYVTDSSSEGPNGIIVVDLGTGAMHRRLDNHVSTRPDPALVARSEGKELVVQSGAGKGKPFQVGIDGIAVTEKHVYYRPLSSHHLYRVDAAYLANPNVTTAQLEGSLEDLGDQGFASDGLLVDAAGGLYLTDYENNAVRRRGLNGTLTILVQDPRLLWPDTLFLAEDGNLYVTSTQIQRGALLNGSDARTKPFTIFKVNVDQKPEKLAAK